MRRILLIGVVLALSAPALPTYAEDKKPTRADRKRATQAKAAFEGGKKAYNIGDFDKAVELWKEGYELKDDPIFLYNIAQAYRQKGDGAKAIFYYKGYLREMPEARNRTEVEQRIAELQKAIDEAEKAAQPQPPPEPPPPATPVPVEPTPVTPATTVADTTPSKPGAGMRVAGIVTMSAGGAALIAGTLFGLRAKSIAGELEDATRAGQPWSQELADKESQGKSMNTLAIIGFTVGAAAVATGGVLYYLGMRKDASAEVERAEVIPVVGPGGAQVTLRLRF